MAQNNIRGSKLENRKDNNIQPLKEKLKSITVLILENLWQTLNETNGSFLDYKSAYRSAYGNTLPKYYNYRKYSNNIESLRHRGYVTCNHKDGQKSIELTSKAKLKILDKIAADSEQDNKYRFVSFDIPEHLSRNRDKFRKAIKQLGFRQVQKSLWVTNCNISTYVELAAYEFKVEKYVVYIISEKTDIDGLIDTMFRLGSKSLTLQS